MYLENAITFYGLAIAEVYRQVEPSSYRKRYLAKSLVNQPTLRKMTRY